MALATPCSNKAPTLSTPPSPAACLLQQSLQPATLEASHVVCRGSEGGDVIAGPLGGGAAALSRANHTHLLNVQVAWHKVQSLILLLCAPLVATLSYSRQESRSHDM